ncbi:MAG: fumarylacetoacetate hydrolase family protein [Novosphingobium sp.]|nr:fumarylacetoacetate hydrolase family protein [Novosphingobium sp.]
MKLVTFTDQISTRIGVVQDDLVLDLSRLAPSLPTDMVTFLAAGRPALDAASQAAASATGTGIALGDVRLETPVPRPRKFLAIALNYRLLAPFKDMTDEEFETICKNQRATKAQGRQSWYNKQVSCINAPFGDIVLPPAPNEVYFEAELAFVIGRTCRDITEAEAADYIAGFMVSNDVTEGAWCRDAATLTMGKSLDSFGPMGPWLVTPDELGDPHRLAINGYVNGELQQIGNTGDMLFNCYELIAFASRRFTLEPGDIVTTGMPYCPLEKLSPGDLVRCEIEAIGAIENRVVGKA